ncbi:substrate-binding domain-containing protein [Phycisphaerales bacterium AB-hyl4]|uniref:Substrate-binding domain-containing protein n=1 Tax=Natronomicrosphaera hydrolytica TaxID=3242702 RepID=A0ABV4U917_9BACT
MSMLVRFHIPMVLFAAWLILAGCGSEGEGDRRLSRDGDTRPTVGVSLPGDGQKWHAGVHWWAEQAMAEHSEVDWLVQRAEHASEQAAQIDDMLKQGIDALIILALDEDTSLASVRHATDVDVYVVSVDRALHEPIADLFVTGDHAAFGRVSAEFIVQQLDFQGRVVILRGGPTAGDRMRYEAAMEVFGAHPGIEVLDTLPGEGDREQSAEAMRTALAEHDTIGAVWAGDDEMALGVEEAVLAAGRADEMLILGGGGMSQIVGRVKEQDPLFPATVAYSPAMMAVAVHLAVAEVLYDGDEQAVAAMIPAHLRLDAGDLLGLAEPRPTEQRRLILPVQLITQDNAADYHFPDSVY